MHLELNLSNHCIQTELKRQHNRAVAAYFRSGAEGRLQIEQIIEMTQQALVTLDFAHLRAACPPLAGGTPASVVLQKRHERIDICVDGTTVGSFEIKGEVQ